MKNIALLLIILTCTGCVRTKLVPELYMPTPPEVLMREPPKLTTIRTESAQ